MSEPISTEMSMGGRIRRQLAPGLCMAIADEDVSREWSDGCFRPEAAEELLVACQEKDGVRVLWRCDDQANYGRLDLLEQFREREKIPFRHKSDARFDIDTEVIEFRPETGRVRYSRDTSGKQLVPLSIMAEVAAAVDKAESTADGQTALELLRRLRNTQQLIHEKMPVVMPPLEPFETVD